MNWFIRETSLTFAVGSLIVELQPSWAEPAIRSMLVVCALLATGALVARMLNRTPLELDPVNASSQAVPGEVRRMNQVEQANDFLLAVDYQLYPFLQAAVREIATQRLLVHHHIELARDPETAQRILGNAVWQVVRPGIAGEDSGARWGNITIAQLEAVRAGLERV